MKIKVLPALILIFLALVNGNANSQTQDDCTILSSTDKFDGTKTLYTSSNKLFETRTYESFYMYFKKVQYKDNTVRYLIGIKYRGADCLFLHNRKQDGIIMLVDTHRLAYGAFTHEEPDISSTGTRCSEHVCYDIPKEDLKLLADYSGKIAIRIQGSSKYFEGDMNAVNHFCLKKFFMTNMEGSYTDEKKTQEDEIKLQELKVKAETEKKDTAVVKTLGCIGLIALLLLLSLLH